MPCAPWIWARVRGRCRSGSAAESQRSSNVVRYLSSKSNFGFEVSPSAIGFWPASPSRIILALAKFDIRRSCKTAQGCAGLRGLPAGVQIVIVRSSNRRQRAAEARYSGASCSGSVRTPELVNATCQIALAQTRRQAWEIPHTGVVVSGRFQHDSAVVSIVPAPCPRQKASAQDCCASAGVPDRSERGRPTRGSASDDRILAEDDGVTALDPTVTYGESQHRLGKLVAHLVHELVNSVQDGCCAVALLSLVPPPRRPSTMGSHAVDYESLSSPERGRGSRIPLSVRVSRFLRRRHKAIGLFALVIVVALSGLYVVGLERADALWRGSPEPEVVPEPEPLPPLYPEWHRAELALPQHADPSRAFEGGRKYMWVSDHTQSSGFGNFMQDMMMNAQLVYETGRSYVFDNFTWDRDGPDYSVFRDKTIPSRIPLSALISGPIVGGPFADNDNTPRAVIKQYWDQICPNPTVIRADEIRPLHGEGATARKIIDTWVNYIKDIEDPCLEVERHSGSIFHIFMFGTPHEILPVWPVFSESPILKLFGWSNLAHQAFAANRHLFAPEPLIAPYVTTPSCPRCVDPYAPLDGLLAIHIRHGDFLEHCPNLAAWGAGFNAFNMFPSFPDLWVSPEGDDETRRAVYMRRCLPTVAQVVEKVESVRTSAAGRGLRAVYVMSNADRAWLAELTAALHAAHGWEHVATSRDLVLTPEQKYTSQAIDMLIGERAQVLIGNGFSSMTSNIAMLRMGRKHPPDTTRMF